jgi:hypothetical protein
MACAACARYDASVREGVRALRRQTVEIEPSSDFRERLRARIAAGAEPAVPVTPIAAAAATLLMLVASIGLLISESHKPDATATAPARTAVPAPQPLVVVNPGLPFVTFTDLSVPAFQGIITHDATDVILSGWASLPR